MIVKREILREKYIIRSHLKIIANKHKYTWKKELPRF